MAELIYAKKRLQPMIDKFGIDPATDKVFQSIITLFNEQTDYQMWGIKLVYTRATSLDNLVLIKNWADANPTEIQHLSLKNLVLYKNTADIVKLHNEIASIDAYHCVKNALNTFNTEQRNLLKDFFLSPVEDAPYKALNLKRFNDFYKKVSAFVKLPEHRKNKFITLMSAVRNVEEIMVHINKALEETYEWNREDMLAYAQRNCPNAEVCYDKDNVVILRLDSFNSAQKLCGNGRTSWCLTRESSYFRRYTEENNYAQQFALFNFNHKEQHELAHVGFSVRPDQGINYAHSTLNHNMMSDIDVNGVRWNIHKLLDHLKIPKSSYVRLRKLTNYKWDLKEFIKKYSNHTQDKVIELPDGRIAVPLTNNTIKDFVVNHTLIRNLPNDSTHQLFAILDFSKNYNDENALLVVSFSKDLYGSLSLSSLHESYGNKVTEPKLIREYNIDDSLFVKSNELSPDILLHKLIDEDNIEVAIKLLAENKDIDPNTMFYNNLPIIKAIMKADAKLFAAITDHDKFDMNLTEGFGEPYAHFALLYMQSYAQDKSKDTKPYVEMCMSLLSNDKYDNSRQDSLGDTVLHTACESGKDALPIVEFLVHDPSVDVNAVNMWGYAPIDVAIETQNMDAVRILLKHPNIEIRKETQDLAKSIGLDIKALFEEIKSTSDKTSEEYEKLFANAFSILKK